MKFAVEQADHYKPYEDYGLKTMAWTYDAEVLTDADEIAESEEISFRFSEIEIESLAELLEFQKKAKCPLIIEDTDDFWKEFKALYPYKIRLYNDWIE